MNVPVSTYSVSWTYAHITCIQLCNFLSHVLRACSFQSQLGRGLCKALGVCGCMQGLECLSACKCSDLPFRGRFEELRL